MHPGITRLAAALALLAALARADDAPPAQAGAGEIGVVLSTNSAQKVVAVAADGPAGLAGIRPGDSIILVDDRSTDGMSATDLLAALRGAAGTAVRVTVLKRGGAVEVEHSLTRAAADQLVLPAAPPSDPTDPTYSGGSDDSMAQVLLALKGISDRLDRIEQSLKSPVSSGLGTGLSRANVAALAGISYPTNQPSRENLRKFVDDVLRASAGQNAFSSNDPQVDMLAQLGEDNIDILLDAAAAHEHGAYHVNYAIQQLATERSRKKIVEALKQNKNLAGLIYTKGWQQDARDTLLRGLGADYLPREWITAVASLRDPTTYDALIAQFVNGQNRASTYEAIRDLPGIKLEDAIAQAWARIGNGSRWEQSKMAIIAAEHGHEDALAALIRSLTTSPSEFRQGDARLAIGRLTELPYMSDADLQRWYESRKGHLVFDKATGKYR